MTENHTQHAVQASHVTLAVNEHPAVFKSHHFSVLNKSYVAADADVMGTGGFVLLVLF